MNSTIRFMTADDKSCVMKMMREFYSSPAVSTNGSDGIFSADIENCLNDSPYLEGYIFENSGDIQGYAMVAKSFSTEFGKPCIWIEDLYIRKEYRGQGIGRLFMDFIADKYPDCLLRLEVEEENETAIKLYRKSGFTPLPYMELKK